MVVQLVVVKTVRIYLVIVVMMGRLIGRMRRSDLLPVLQTEPGKILILMLNSRRLRSPVACDCVLLLLPGPRRRRRPRCRLFSSLLKFPRRG